MSDFSDNLNEVDDRNSKSRRWLLGAIAGVAVAAGVGWGWLRRSADAAPTDAAQALWKLTLDTPHGGKLAMQTLRGKPLLVNFWATWCPPCVEELPLLNRFFNENKANGWQIVGIAVDQRDPVNRFLSHTPLQFPIGLAGFSGIELGKMLGNLSGGLPFSVVLGSDGEVLHRKMGQLTREELAAWSGLR